MPPLSKNKWLDPTSNMVLNMDLNMVQADLERIDWTQRTTDNLTIGERCDLQNRKNIVIKNSDKGENVVILNQQHYEKEAKRLLN